MPGNGAKIDEDGYLWVLGRIDDEVSIAGHRISTLELESTLVAHPDVTEAAIVGIPHEVKGKCLVAFVTTGGSVEPDDKMIGRLKDFVTRKIGAIAKPERVIFTPDLSKTRSGKIMRRLLRDIALGKIMGDTTTLADPDALNRIKKRCEDD